MHDEPGSHGFIRYRILPKKDLSLGEEIDNKAHIYFDFHEAIITNVSRTVIEKHAQISALLPSEIKPLEKLLSSSMPNQVQV
jgi:hypothetical protein